MKELTQQQIEDICEKQTLSEDFIREFKDQVSWNWICEKQNLSEDFIREFRDKVNWICISQFQKLSPEFFIEFKDKVNIAVFLNDNKYLNGVE